MTTWLSILQRHEHLLDFDVLLGGYIEYLNGDKTAIRGTGEDEFGTAVSSIFVMSFGVHYTEFLITGTPHIGIVGPMPGLNTGAYQEGDFFFIGNTSKFVS